MHLIYITFPNNDEAVKICEHLVNKDLVACANIYHGTTSIYKWEGSLNHSSEVVAILKTKDSNIDEVIDQVKSVHQYEIPCITAIKIEKGNEDFIKWVENS